MDKADRSEKGISGVNDDFADFETLTIDFNQPDTLVGQLLDGRFLIEKDLADSGADAGGMGLVYLAKDMNLMGKDVVVKILQESALKHEDIGRKFLHEKEALIRLDHPGIVRILDSGALTDGNPFMVMEFIEGYSLRKVLRTTGKLSLDVVADLIESITDALAAAHSKNILHRDIKPENIMLTPQEDDFDHVRLIDFGIARVGESQLAPATVTSRSIGTIRYIPPEQLIGRLDLTPAADIYSVAIVAYEMLTGELPFKPKAIAEMYKLEQEGVKTPPSQLRTDLPKAAEKILLLALEFEPENRPQNARAFGRDLARALRGEAVSGSRNPIKTVLRVLIGFFGAGTILLLGFIIYGILSAKPGPSDLGENTEITDINKPDSIVKHPESTLPDTFDRYYEGSVDGKRQTPLIMQLVRTKAILKGLAKTVSTFDELSGSIDPDGSFQVNGTPVGKPTTGIWKGRINLDGTVTGTWTTKDGTNSSSFKVTEKIINNTTNENK